MTSQRNPKQHSEKAKWLNETLTDLNETLKKPNHFLEAFFFQTPAFSRPLSGLYRKWGSPGAPSNPDGDIYIYIYIMIVNQYRSFIHAF